MPDPNAVLTRPEHGEEPADDDTTYFLQRFREWTAMPGRENEG